MIQPHHNSSRIGSFQNKRLSDLLTNEYIQVDERGLAELVLALKAYAENVNYYDLDGQVNGSWLDLLLSNDSVLYATTSAVNLAALKNDFYDQKSSGQLAVIQKNLQHITWINNWFSNIRKINTADGQQFSIKTKNVIKCSLTDCINDLLRFYKGYDSSDRILNELDDELWSIDENSLQQDSHGINHDKLKTDERLTEIFNTILNVLSFLKHESSIILQKSLTRQNHNPASSLVLSFLLAYKQSQQKMNDFSARLLEFYYTDIQKNRCYSGGGDKAILVCDLNPENDPVVIPEGSRFIAGKTADLEDIIYVNSQQTVISGVKLGALKTLFLQRHLLVSPENFTQSVTAIRSSDVLNHFDDAEDSNGHSLFGYDDGCSGVTQGVNSDIGLVISSRLLELKQGQRSIKLEFKINDRKLQEISSSIDIKKLLTQWPALDSENVDQLCQLFFNKMSDLIAQDDTQLSLKEALLDAFKSFSFQEIDNEDKTKLINDLLHTTLLIWLKKSDSILTFKNIYHQLISRYMFIEGFLNQQDKDSILSRANHLLASDQQYKLALNRIRREINLPPGSLLIHYFYRAFSLSISTQEGWTHIDRYALSRSKDDNGFVIAFTMNKSKPPIVNFDKKIHSGNHRPGIPVLIMRIKADAKIYPYSYLQLFNIIRLKLKVAVKGFNDLVVQNDYGLVDRSKPFLAFGPVPVQGSCCYVGGYEYARKKLSALIVNIKWKNLPRNYGGFSGYYAGYGQVVSNSDYRVRLSTSASGGWIPVHEEQQQITELFDEQPATGILKSEKQIEVNLKGQQLAIDLSVNESQYIDMSHLNNGYLKMELSTTNLVFGHKIYPGVMAQTLSGNSKNKKQISLPEQPYTPEIASISIDYSAQEDITLQSQYIQHGNLPEKHGLNHTEFASSQQESFIHYVTSLGVESVYEEAASCGVSFFPEWPADGNLNIGFLKSKQVKSFNLYFDLKNDSEQSVMNNRLTILWCYYSHTGWKVLNREMILRDTTQELKHSGIITFRLPDDLVRNIEMEPLNHFWLRASSSTSLESYSSIQQLVFDTLTVHSVNDTSKLTAHQQGYSKKWRCVPDIAGIHSCRQHQVAFDNQDAETLEQSRVRFHERLRHKNRAINNWDYERLVLQAFPGIYMVKCFSATSIDQLEPAPGNVLVIVVPKIVAANKVYRQGYQVNSVVLQEITDYLKKLMPQNCILQVRNPVYDRIQIRCAVTFKKSGNSGDLVEKLNADIFDYISPWSERGYSVKFDWTIRKKDVESYILDLPYIADVARFSIINISKVMDRPKKYTLVDSAVARKISSESTEPKKIIDDIYSTMPWSLAIPVEKHYIEQVNGQELIQQRKAEPVGINNIRIGNTFIIKGCSDKSIGNRSDAIA